MSQAESDHDAVSDVCEKSSWNVFKKGDENLEESTRNMMKMMELLSESKNVIREMMEDRWKLKKEIEELKKQTKVKKMIPEKQKKSKKLEETQSERENERPPLKAHDSSNLQVECKPKESLEINKKIECLQNQLKSLEILSEKQKLHEKELESQRKLIEKYTFMRQKTMKKDVKMKKKKIPFSHTISQRLTDPTNYTVQCPSLVKSCEWRNIPLRRPSQENFVPFEKKPSENCSKHIFLKPKNNFFGENNVHQDVSSSNIKNLEKLCSERKMAQKSEECALPKNFKDLYLKKPLHSAPRITFSLQNESFNNKNNNALDSNCHLPEKFQNGFYPGLERTSKKEDDKTDGEVTEKDERKVASATSDQDSDGHLHVASGNKSPKRKIDKMKKNVFKNKKNLKMNKLEKMVEKQKCELKSPRRDGVPPSEQSDIQVLQQKQMLENFLISKVQREKKRLERDMQAYEKRLRQEKQKLVDFLKDSDHEKQSTAKNLYGSLVRLEKKCVGEGLSGEEEEEEVEEEDDDADDDDEQESDSDNEEDESDDDDDDESSQDDDDNDGGYNVNNNCNDSTPMGACGGQCWKSRDEYYR